jgi:hypothetical protein
MKMSCDNRGMPGALPPVPCPRAARRSRARDLSWALLVTAAAATPPLAVLASGRTLAWRDTASLFAPLRGLVVEALRELRLPLWNPHEALGIPLFAQMIHGVLHPVSVVAAFVAPGSGTDALVVAHVALAALGAGLLARTLGASAAGAAAAALGYALSGYVLGMSAVLTYLAAGATAPWTLAAMRLAGEGRRWGIAATGAALAAQHFAGDPQWTVVAVAVGAALALDAGGGRGLVRAATGVVVGTAVAAVQLAPAWAFLGETRRAGSLTDAERVQWALSPWRLVETVAPGLFGARPGETLASPVFLWLGGPTGPGLSIPFVQSVFIGAPVLALALAAVRASRTARLLGGAALVLLWMALGFHGGAEQALRAVPVWSAFRYTEKLVGPVTLCVCVLAGLGADRIARRPSGHHAVAWLSAGGAATLAAAALVLMPSLEVLAPAGAPPVAVHAARLALAGGLGNAAAGMLALGLLAALPRRSGRLAAAYGPAVAALVFAQSAAASPYALRAGAPGARDPRPLQALRAEGAVTRIETPLDDPPYRTPTPLDEADREVAVRSRLGAAPYAVPSRIDQVNTYTGLLPRRLRLLGNAFGPDVWRAMRRYAVTHVVLKEAADEGQAAEAAEAVHGGTPVASWPEWRISGWAVPHRPWCTFAEGVVRAAGEREALDALVAAELAGIPRVVVEAPERAPAGPGRVLTATRGLDRVRVEAEGEDGVLVVNDAWAPGWYATIDGRPVPIWRADFLVRAVPWPAGRHVLEMRYAPPEVALGEAISIAGLLALAAAVVIPAVRRMGQRAAV